jgi:hypothetical protein
MYPFLTSLLLTVVSKLPFIKSFVIFISDCLNYFEWLQKVFDNPSLNSSRHVVFNKMLSEGGEIHGIEFGVFQGHLTYWWLKNGSQHIKRWDGFDTFTGLPDSWRDLPSGTFDVGGSPPMIDDSRISWHIGDVKNTIHELKIDDSRTSKLVVFFDLDLFEPSLVCWNFISSHLRKGDILYFDEAFDLDERSLLQDYILSSGKFNFLAASWQSLAIVRIEK